MGAQDADRLAALDEERFVVPEREQRTHDRPQRVVVPRRLAGAPVDNELFRALCDLRVEVVQEHPQGRLGRPGPGIQLRSARRSNRREVAAECLDRLSETVDRRHRSCRSSSSR